MNTSAAIPDPLFRRACGWWARPVDPRRTGRVRLRFSRLRAPVSPRGLRVSSLDGIQDPALVDEQRTVMNHAG